MSWLVATSMITASWKDRSQNSIANSFMNAQFSYTAVSNEEHDGGGIRYGI
jgi:hypothetical protein